jgi:hypothetical protein
MIDREWLESHKQLFMEYYDSNFLRCRFDNRAIDTSISSFLDGTYATNIFFPENDSILFRSEINGLDMSLSKELATEWMINEIAHDKLVELNENIVQTDIYDYYIEGENAMMEYHWQKVKDSLREMVKYISTEKLKLMKALELSSQ